MNRLVFLVEGDSELYFVQNRIIPYLYLNGAIGAITCQKITTNRKLNISGGNVSYNLFKNELDRIYAQGGVVVTTFLDFFRLPNNFPNHGAGNPDDIEAGMLEDNLDNRNYIPYIQKHEFEAIFFSDISNFYLFVDSNDKREAIESILNEFPNPEDINSHPNRYPAKRLKDILGYNKGADAELIIESCSIEMVISKCPRFAVWIEKLINLYVAA
ncbi:DUF4276 family protein [Sphingobacterium hungaricum]|nr:DUF4276 family protein [Sphingobacterium hungaricum]